MGYGPEVEMIRIAHEMNLLTTPYAFKESEAEQMADAGADILVAHMGLTTKGSIGAKTALTLEESAKRVQAIHDAAKSVNPEILVICHGGPIAEPDGRTVHFGQYRRRCRILRCVKCRASSHGTRDYGTN